MSAVYCVEIANRIVTERFVTIGGVMVSCRVSQQRKKTISVVMEPGCVCEERSPTGRGVLESGCVAEERFKTHGGIVTARSVMEQGTKANGRIRDTVCKILKCAISLSCVKARIASIWRWCYRACSWHKDNAHQDQWDDNQSPP